MTLINKYLIKKYKLTADRYPQIEEYVHGEGYGCSVLYSKGKFITHFTHRRLRDKIETGGTSTFREATVHQGIEAATKTIFDSFKGEIVSVISFESNNKVTSTNLKYPLNSYKLSPSPRAIRNQSLGDSFTIESSEKLMVFQIKD